MKNSKSRKDYAKSLKEFIFSIFYFFRQIGQYLPAKFGNSVSLGGNLDPMYLYGLKNYVLCFRDKIRRQENLIFLTPFCLIVLSQVVSKAVFGELGSVKWLKYGVTLAKIILCVGSLVLVKRLSKRINVLRIIEIITFLGLVSFLFALFFRNSFLWRNNDYINGFDLSRLQLFYLEPSELGFHTALIIIVLVYMLFDGEEKNYKKLSLLLIINSVILYFSKALGSIAILGCFCCVFLLKKVIPIVLNRIKVKRNRILILFMAIIIFLLAIVFCLSSTSIGGRMLTVLTGDDSSVNFRVKTSVRVLGRSLVGYRMIGTGFGNVNTREFISRYSDLGLSQMPVNSFIYFWIETGVVGIIIWIVSLFLLTRKVFEENDSLKKALFLFVVLYQFVGSHYTNGLIWMIYGFILSPMKVKGNFLTISSEKVDKIRSLSIITPFYNGEKYIEDLKKTVGKIASRSIGVDVEWVIVNDSPWTKINRKHFLVEGVNVKIIDNKENIGIQRSRIKGIDNAKNDYILFLDQDDFVDEKILEKVNKNYRREFDAYLFNGFDELKGMKKPIYKNIAHGLLATRKNVYLSDQNYIVSPGQCIIKKTAIPHHWMVCPLQKQGSDDYYFWILFFNDGCKMKYIDEKYYIHKRTTDNFSSDIDKMKASDYDMLDNLSGLLGPSDRKKLSRALNFKYERINGKKLTYLLHPIIMLRRIICLV